MYNEQVRDLMSPGGHLALRVDAGGDAVVAGLTVHKVTYRLISSIGDDLIYIEHVKLILIIY